MYVTLMGLLAACNFERPESAVDLENRIAAVEAALAGEGLVGAAEADGATGPTGPAGPNGADGADGTCVCDEATLLQAVVDQVAVDDLYVLRSEYDTTIAEIQVLVDDLRLDLDALVVPDVTGLASQVADHETRIASIEADYVTVDDLVGGVDLDEYVLDVDLVAALAPYETSTDHALDVAGLDARVSIVEAGYLTSADLPPEVDVSAFALAADVSVLESRVGVVEAGYLTEDALVDVATDAEVAAAVGPLATAAALASVESELALVVEHFGSDFGSGLTVREIALDAVDAAGYLTAVDVPDEAALAWVDDVSAVLTVVGTEAVFEGVNVHVRNALGDTDFTDGTGNLIVGWNEGGDSRTGSHNVVVGRGSSWTSYGSIIVGEGHQVSGNYGAVIGGTGNVMDGTRGVIIGGNSNTVSSGDGWHAVIVGGGSSLVADESGVVVGGQGNIIDATNPEAQYEVVVGGEGNTVQKSHAVAVGGRDNLVNGTHAVVIGGALNYVTGDAGAVFGGRSNEVQGGSYDVVAGGADNTATGGLGEASAIFGGTLNGAGDVMGEHAVIVGGESNIASGDRAVVVGGGSNTCRGARSMIVGGYQSVSDFGDSNSLVVGGSNHYVLASAAVILGGEASESYGRYSIVAGGEGGLVTGEHSVLVGGDQCEATHDNSAVVGGISATTNSVADVEVGPDL